MGSEASNWIRGGAGKMAREHKAKAKNTLRHYFAKIILPFTLAGIGVTMDRGARPLWERLSTGHLL